MTNTNNNSADNQIGKSSTTVNDSNSAQSRTIKVDGMTGDTCVQKVSGALKGVEGVTTKSVTVGSATIEADRDGYAAACSAIKDAGYKVQDSGQNRSDQNKSGRNQSGQNQQGRQDRNEQGQSKQGQPSALSRPGSDQDKRGDNRSGSTPPPMPQRAPTQPNKSVR